MLAYDLLFENPDTDTVLRDPARPQGRGGPLPRPTEAPAGWIGSAGPGIAPEAWPRGPLTGLPMFHVLTLALPPEFRRRGEEFPAIAFFQGEGQFAEETDEDDVDDDPFLADVEAAVEHPQHTILTDIIDGQFALIWLTEQEFLAGPTAPPADTRRPGEHEAEDEGPNAWDELHPTLKVWLTERPDPNAGLVPSEDETEGGYRPAAEWAGELSGRCHLGGTVMPVQALPEGLTPYFLELEETPGTNYGGGNLQLDLESGVFDWAC